MRKLWQRWWQVKWQIHNKRNHVMSHKITNRLPHLCNGVHWWVFMSVIFMTVSKIECQNLEMIYNFLGEKHHNNYYKFGIKNTIHMKWASGWFKKTCPCHFVTGKLIKVHFWLFMGLKNFEKILFVILSFPRNCTPENSLTFSRYIRPSFTGKCLIMNGLENFAVNKYHNNSVPDRVLI